MSATYTVSITKKLVQFKAPQEQDELKGFAFYHTQMHDIVNGYEKHLKMANLVKHSNKEEHVDNPLKHIEDQKAALLAALEIDEEKFIEAQDALKTAVGAEDAKTDAKYHAYVAFFRTIIPDADALAKFFTVGTDDLKGASRAQFHLFKFILAATAEDYRHSKLVDGRKSPKHFTYGAIANAIETAGVRLQTERAPREEDEKKFKVTYQPPSTLYVKALKWTRALDRLDQNMTIENFKLVQAQKKSEWVAYRFSKINSYFGMIPLGKVDKPKSEPFGVQLKKKKQGKRSGSSTAGKGRRGKKGPKTADEAAAENTEDAPAEDSAKSQDADEDAKSEDAAEDAKSENTAGDPEDDAEDGSEDGSEDEAEDEDGPEDGPEDEAEGGGDEEEAE